MARYPDLFWDDDGKAYIASAGIYLQSVDLSTGGTGQAVDIWNGTGSPHSEAPHVYKKDGWYYLLIAEGGTEPTHRVTIARSRHIFGPFESYSKNPILTNSSKNWWGVALATRGGPNWEIYHMGGGTVLFPAKWEKDQWPVLESVRGHMKGPQPRPNKNVPGSGAWVGSGDVVNFEPGSQLPKHFVHWRPPPNRAVDYSISPKAHRYSMGLKASVANLTASAGYQPTDGQTFVARRQAHTRFQFSIDISVSLTRPSQESGLSVFLTSHQHITLSLFMPQNSRKGPQMRLQTIAFGKPNITAPDTVMMSIPKP
ncbi:Non-reducing end alpha-L-arabinofuranosidase BoGH43A [Fusarium oxysporum f. sp. raphani]|uniref:Non-reducing end alpha-L-arabinofuranosidase BoGH43A n=1 Tax=Fusarium oxysporum f. sp. raphani TaxID=96318 RepID=A0A8J5QEA8_FUSOX|nr:Non-reducing end alpha-L-arabinofuranosidase BoGH43A [Fusarium oxysporum f. sp. raphani]